jgi:hypothetical protein
MTIYINMLKTFGGIKYFANTYAAKSLQKNFLKNKAVSFFLPV